VRRRAPRSIRSALAGFTRDAAPATTLSRVQGCWGETVGSVIAAEAQPVSERDGTLTVACRSATWASELELLGPELLDKLNQAIGGNSGGPLTRLRAKVAGPP
jgi:predicted nucleic acid-binding Zn ribbon protein